MWGISVLGVVLGVRLDIVENVACRVAWLRFVGLGSAGPGVREGLVGAAAAGGAAGARRPTGPQGLHRRTRKNSFDIVYISWQGAVTSGSIHVHVDATETHARRARQSTCVLCVRSIRSEPRRGDGVTSSYIYDYAAAACLVLCSVRLVLNCAELNRWLSRAGCMAWSPASTLPS